MVVLSRSKNRMSTLEMASDEFEKAQNGIVAMYVRVLFQYNISTLSPKIQYITQHRVVI